LVGTAARRVILPARRAWGQIGSRRFSIIAVGWFGDKEIDPSDLVDVSASGLEAVGFWGGVRDGVDSRRDMPCESRTVTDCRSNCIIRREAHATVHSVNRSRAQYTSKSNEIPALAPLQRGYAHSAALWQAGVPTRCQPRFCGGGRDTGGAQPPRVASRHPAWPRWGRYRPLRGPCSG